MALKPGTRLGPYEILSLLGAGGMGEVYKGRDVRLDRLVALKLLAPHLTHHPESRDRFEREATTIANLKHAHICVLYDIGKENLARASFEEPSPAGHPDPFGPELSEGAAFPGLPQGRLREGPALSPLLRRQDIGGQADAGEGAGTGDHERVPVDFLVLEYLEGETLSQRLARGPLPLAEAMQYAVEIADALDKAHRAGVTHRDIKPGNIMLVPTSNSGSHGMSSMPWAQPALRQPKGSGSGPEKTHGTENVPWLPPPRAKMETKLLDFGLAKLKQEVAKATIPASERPTIPGGALTQDGTILGTLHYMAPEQLESKEVDGRADIFSFGAVVHEMATGKRAFPGETQASIIAKILDHNPPPVSSLEPPGKLSPPALDRIVEKCLRKDREDRWQSARDLTEELKWIKDGGSQTGMPAPLSARRKLRERLAWGMAAIVILLFGALAAVHFREAPPESALISFAIPAPENGDFVPDTAIAVSPDGSQVAFAAIADGKRALWVRPLGSLTARPLPGTENAVNPFWSPDGQFLGFFSGGGLLKIALSGGPPQPLTDTEGGGAGRTGTWNREGTIVFTPRTILPIHRVSASGGQSTPVTVLNESRQETGHTFPSFLPDGLHFLYFARSARPENNAVFVGSLDSTEAKFLFQADSGAIYNPPGYLLFLRGVTLTAQAFDAERLELSGEPFPVAEVARTDSGIGSPAFSTSESGVLAYRNTGRDMQLAWVDREGRQAGTVGPPGEYLNTALSPDERRVVIDRYDATLSTRDLWLYDLARGTASRLTFGPADDSDAFWSPDGEQIVFGSNGGGANGLVRKSASGAGQEEVLVETRVTTYPRDWSSDGRFVLYQTSQGGVADLWVLPLFGDRKPIPFLQTEFAESEGRFSPNGRWIAYHSTESRRNEIYVQSFPASAGKWQISAEGGYVPKWGRDGKELFYIAADGRFMVVPVNAGATFEAGVPKALFQTSLVGFPVGGYNHYAVSADSQRFLLNVPAGEGNKSPITVVLNWQKAVTSGK